MMENKIRSKKGMLTSAVGIACNIALAAVKIAVGFIFGLVSVMADGFNNLSDFGSSAVSLVSFRIAEKPADKKHPYGHRRAEYIAAMVTGFLVLSLAVEFVRESIQKIASGENSESSFIVYIVLAASIAIKAGMFIFYRVMSAKLQSDAIKAAATDSLCDCIATTVVIASLLIFDISGFRADGWAGILVALFIFWQGIKIFAEAGSKLLGQAPTVELTDKIKEIILSQSGVIGMHDLRVYNYGHDLYFATAHVEMDASLPALESHAAIDAIEQEVKLSLNILLTAHHDPVDLQDTEARELEQKVRNAIKACEATAELHDFRLVRGAENKVIFDLEVPYSCKKKDGALQMEIENIIRNLGDYEPIITIERK